ncbi:MAG TPA: type II toxin-antitoxin system VapC family toxin [Burkholderiaceae bacterium]
MSATVVDATALAAVAFDEPERDEVAAKLSGPLVAPALLPFELAVVCVAKLRRDPERSETILRQYRIARELDIGVEPVSLEEIPMLCERFGLTVNTAAYLWLALAHRAQLVTLDARLASAHARAVKQQAPPDPAAPGP